jgi:hypothetical protein
MERTADRRSNEELSPEVAAIFEKMCRYLEDENAQNDRLPQALRLAVNRGASCDLLPGAWGILAEI